MSLSRRDLIKIAAAGGAAMALPFERGAFTPTPARGAAAGRSREGTALGAGRLYRDRGVAHAYQCDAEAVLAAVPASAGAVAGRYVELHLPRRTGAQLPALRGQPDLRRGQHHAGVQDADLRLQRGDARTHDPRPARHADRGEPEQPAAPATGVAVPELADAVEVHLGPVAALDVHAPARLRVAPAVRRVRLRRRLPGAAQGVLLPELAGGAHPLVPRPRRAPHLAERVQRSGRDVHPARPERAEARDPAGRVRRADRRS